MGEFAAEALSDRQFVLAPVFEKGDREIFKKGLVVGDPETRKSI